MAVYRLEFDAQGDPLFVEDNGEDDLSAWHDPEPDVEDPLLELEVKIANWLKTAAGKAEFQPFSGPGCAM
ncbi:MAG: hypothetical protein R3200_08395 [Xanthomonadales bacterium]|nr:hypothetical protein [Xanthomonadales bacterium]